MGLFDFFKNKKVVIPEPNAEELTWFFSDKGKNAWESSLVNKTEMYDLYHSEYGESLIAANIQKEGNRFRTNLPCTFFADYLRALKTVDSAKLAFLCADLSIDGAGAPAIPYPECLKAEHNPLINFALKIKTVYHEKNGRDIMFSTGFKMILSYLHELFLNGFEDESNEDWLYQKELWFTPKGKLREMKEIDLDIKAKVKHKELIE